MPPKTAPAPASKPLEDSPSTKRNPQMTAGKEGVVKPAIPTSPVAASSSLKGVNVSKGHISYAARYAEVRAHAGLSGSSQGLEVHKEINTLTTLNDSTNDEKIAQLRNDKRSAEVRCAEVRTLMPTLENTLSERVRDTEDRIDSLSSAVAYHEKTIQELMREMEALPAVIMAAPVNAKHDSGESVEVLALKCEAAQGANKEEMPRTCLAELKNDFLVRAKQVCASVELLVQSENITRRNAFRKLSAFLTA